MGYTYKITRPVHEKRNDETTKLIRREYVRWYNSNDPYYKIRNLIYIDESPFNICLFRSHGCAPKSKTPNPVVKSRSQNVTMIVAVNGLNIVHCEAICSSVNGEIFEQFMNEVKRIIGNEEEFTFILDNVNFHHSKDYTEGTNHKIHFLPPYSAFLNPCEEVFSQLKSRVRRDSPPRGTDDLLQRMRESCTSVTQQNLSNYIRHSESFFEDCLFLRDITRN
ncbi:hypothetical protein RF11_02606 [Thelohanellus kitauei]|uniref:Tc1-like transposase DDE domain-containing protein n=1 Tax=Thelohanellus kitauei TaxID=669202 RepID=A0A0C2IG13_THEKT|nr:hypothetical protein RF11_02606 [Thelohanellus kitauei]